MVSNPTIVNGGDIFETGGYVKPVYNDTPPPPVTSGQDDTEVRPGVPTPPPPPPEPNINNIHFQINNIGWSLNVDGMPSGTRITTVPGLDIKLCTTKNASSSALLCKPEDIYRFLVKTPAQWANVNSTYSLWFKGVSAYGPSNQQIS